MLAHLQAIEARLATLGYQTHRVYAAGAVDGQYLVLGAPTWDTPADLPLCGESDELVTDFRVTAVTGTPDGVLIMLKRVRDLLSPLLSESPLPIEGRFASTRFVRSEFVSVDRDETITGTNRHPAFGVDTYHLTSEPT